MQRGNRRARRLVGAAALALAALVASPSAAQPSRDDVQRADALFKEGKSLFDAKSYEAACTKLAESERLDPSIGTLGLLAACHEQVGRLATAHREYVATADRAKEKGDERERYARERAAALAPKVPSLLVRSAEAGVEVRRNGAQIPSEELGIALPTDPGRILVTAEAPGRKAWSKQIDLKPGDRVVVDVPALEVGESAPPPPPPGDQPPQPPVPSSGGSGATIGLGIGLGVLGLVGIGLGSGFGAHASSLDEDSKADGCTRETCEPLREDAFTFAHASTAAFVIGGVALAAGIGLVIAGAVSGDDDAPKAALMILPAAGPGTGGALLRARF